MSTPPAWQIPLGPFELHAPLGGGAMGEVWQGVHRTQGLPVAVKLITAEHARDEATVAAFHNEVRAVARLHHPGIIMVLDYGAVDARAAEASQGRLDIGSPYLAMELASGGTLPRPTSPTPWPRMRALLLELLDALAHAHARGVIHRDIKPGNILISAMHDGRAGLKLTDFGIARAIGLAEQSDGVISGTPTYMSPEQILDERRDQGPWTDLYSLGCLAWQLAAGRRIFAPARGADLLRAHVHVPPPVVGRRDLPEGFNRWLERMLAKEPADRYQLAADAAWGLLELDRAAVTTTHGRAGRTPAGDAVPGHGDDRTTVAEIVDPASAVLPGVLVGSLTDSSIGDALLDDDALGGDTVRVDAHAIRANLEDTADSILADGEVAALADIVHTEWGIEPLDAPGAQRLGALPYPLPPCPVDWRRDETMAPPMRLRGAGLGLFGLRAVPMVDRDESRDRIWSALRDVDESGRGRLIVLQGGAGFGKSRLVEWIAERAHELGAATVLHATHSPHGGRADGVGPMVAAHTGCVDLDRREALERAERFVEEHPLRPGRPTFSDDALALVEVMLPEDNDSIDAPRVHFASPAERHGVIGRFLERVALRRPCIVWLDDVQWGADTLGFVAHFMELQAVTSTPVLLLVTLRDDLLAARPVEAELLDEIRGIERTTFASIGPLPAVAHRKLVEHLLGLENELVDQVATRTEGNPLFATQLIGDWVQRGVLEPGERGFRLKAGERADVPDDIHALWTTRIGQLVASRDEQVHGWLVLELAAALGKDFDVREWRTVCQMAGLTIPHGLLERLLAHRLIEQTPTGFSFAHAMLRESLVRTARDAQRLQAHHLWCARMLEQAYARNPPSVYERRGAHLMLGGAPEQALEPLLQAAAARQFAGDFRQAQRLFTRRNEAMMRLGVPASDPRWGEGWVREARTWFMQGRAEPAADLARRATDAARRYGWREIEATATTEQANAAFAAGRVAEAIELHERALVLYRALDLPHDHADALRHYGKVMMTRHEIDVTERALNEALAIFERLGDRVGAAPVLRHLAAVENHRGHTRRAVELLEDALERFRSHGYRRSLASCLNDLGEIWRHVGRLDEAVAHYQESARMYDAIGSRIAWIPKLNHGLLLLGASRFDEARVVLAPLVRMAEEMRGTFLEEPWFLCAMLPCCAHARDWSHYDAYLARVLERVEAMGAVDPDLELGLRLAGEVAVAQGMPKRARPALEHALKMAQRMGVEANVDRIEALLARLD